MSPLRSLAIRLLLPALAAASLAVSPACNNDIKLDHFLQGVGPSFVATHTFGQLVSVSPSPLAAHYLAVQISPPATDLLTPSSGEVFFDEHLDGLENCLVLKPKLRDEDDATPLDNLGPRLPKPDKLRLALCNLDHTGGAPGSPLAIAVQALYTNAGADAPADETTEFFDPGADLDERKVEVWAAPEAVFPDPPIGDEHKHWSRLGPAEAGILHVALYTEDDDGNKTYVNPAPYLAKIPLSPPASSVRPPTIAEIRLEAADNEDFTIDLRAYTFDLATGAMNPDEELDGFIRVFFRLANTADGGGSAPLVAPHEISYELRERPVGTVRSQGSFFLNALATNPALLLPVVASELGRRVYRVPGDGAPESDPATEQVWMQLPVDPSRVEVGDAVPRHDLGDLDSEALFRLEAVDGGQRRIPPGEYELEIVLASGFTTAASDAKTVRFRVRGATVEVVEDTDNSHTITGADAVATALRIARWDEAYGAAFAIRNNADSHADRNFVERDPRRFYVRVTDATANTDPGVAEQVTARVGTLTGGGATDDDLTDAVLTETGANTGVFVSRSQLLMSDDLPLAPDDDFRAHDGSGGPVDDDDPRDRTHRVRTIDGQVRVAYPPPGGGATVTRDLPVCPRAPADERRRVEVRAIVYNEPFDDVGFDHDGLPATAHIGAGNGVFDFADGNANGSHDAGERSEPYRDFSSVADGLTAPLLRGDDPAVTNGRGPGTTDVEIAAQIERARIAWSPACITVAKIGATTVTDAPAVAGVNILLDGSVNWPADFVQIFAAHAAAFTSTEATAVFAGPITGSAAISFTPDINQAAIGHGEDIFFVQRFNLDIRRRTAAHELGHLFTNRDDVANTQPVFFPALTTFRDDHENSYRRFPEATETQARSVRPAGNLLAAGNTILKNP